VIVVNGVPNLLARLAAAGIAGEAALKVTIDTIGEAVAEEARRIVPVSDEPPHLRDDIQYDSAERKVYTNTIYAGKVEYGGPHNPPEPYMRPAADTVDPAPALGAGKAVMDSA
jgi:hypothetical protein